MLEKIRDSQVELAQEFRNRVARFNTRCQAYLENLWKEDEEVEEVEEEVENTTSTLE
jgi:hypothetical protein